MPEIKCPVKIHAPGGWGTHTCGRPAKGTLEEWWNFHEEGTPACGVHVAAARRQRKARELQEAAAEKHVQTQKERQKAIREAGEVAARLATVGVFARATHGAPGYVEMTTDQARRLLGALSAAEEQ